MLEQKIATMADRDVTAIRNDATICPVKREEIVLRYWNNGDLTPLQVANSLARQGSRIQFA